MAIIVVCCMVWGANQVAVKLAVEAIPPLAQAGLRSVLSGVLLLIWIGVRGIPLLAADRTLLPGLAIGLAFAAEFLCLYPGLSLTTASRGVLLLYAMPFFVAIGAHFLIPGDRLSGRKAAGLLAALAGLAVALGESLLDPRAGNITGDLLCLAAAFFWAAITIIVRTTRLREVSGEKQLMYQLVISAPVLGAASLLAGEPAVRFTGAVPWLAFAYTGLMVAFISYATWFWLLARHPASSLAVFTFLTPIFGAIAGAVMLGEPLSARFLAALGLVAAGIVLVNMPAGGKP